VARVNRESLDAGAGREYRYGMPGSVTKWNEGTAARALRSRRKWRIAGIVLICVLLLSSVVDHLRAQNRGGDDWMRFDGRKVPFIRAVDGESIAIDDGGEDVTIVRILGIRSANADWDERARSRMDAFLAGQIVSIHLEPTQTRDENGRLLADVFTESNQLLGAQLAAEGLVRGDWTAHCTFYADITRAQSLAHKKRVGFWNYD
jgi:endonuclease YncB( thermonuclease family)